MVTKRFTGRRRATLTIATMVAALSCQRAQTASQSRPGVTANPVPSERDSVQRINDRYVQQVLASIAGRESAPAESVFKNVQWLTDVNARTLVGIMNGGYARALGVTCEHCHVTTDFASDEKRPKRAAREMAVMHRGINQRLREMQNLRPAENRAINCNTCHRGMVNPTSPTPPRR